MQSFPTLEAVANPGNLLVAHANAKRGKSHYTAVQEFEERKTELLRTLSATLKRGEYRTSEYRNKTIVDSGKLRLISKLPYFPDRIVHWAIMLQLESEFISKFSDYSHAAITNRGIHTALRQTCALVKKYPYCLKIDVRKYFPHIDHEILKDACRELTEDAELLNLIFEIIDSFPHGVPIGNYTSQYLANYYLSDFDFWLESSGYEFCRYMDDICIYGNSSRELHALRVEIESFLSDRLHLEIKKNWQVFPVSARGVDFVGYRVFPNRVILRKSTHKMMRRRLSRVLRHLREGTFTESDRSTLAAYAGWVKYCSRTARRTIFDKYFAPCLYLMGEDEHKFKSKIIWMLI